MAAQTPTQTRNPRYEGMQQSSGGGVDDAMKPFNDMYCYFQEYAREKPEVVAMWCLGIGFVLGWKLKPW